MTLKELVKYLRVSILDDTGGTGVDFEVITDSDDESQLLRWTNEELTSYINESINQVYRRILPVQKNETTFDITLIAATHTYSFDPRIIRIIGVKLVTAKKQLRLLDTQEIWDLSNTWDTIAGTPTDFIIDYETESLRFFPIPVAADTATLFVNRFPLTTFTWLTDQATSPELRQEYQIPMLYYAAALSYQKDEANSLDPEKEGKFLQLFDREFPFTSAYSEIRKRRTAYRGVRYGGIQFDGSFTRGRKNPYGNNC
jgi:hypothetical protein